jgi:hypothetical protein
MRVEYNRGINRDDGTRALQFICPDSLAEPGNEASKGLGRLQCRGAIVMLFGDAWIGMLKESTCEMRHCTLVDGCTGSAGGTKEVGADRNADRRSCGFGNGLLYRFVRRGESARVESGML